MRALSKMFMSMDSRLRGNDGGTERCPAVPEFTKYYEQTQHLIENKEKPLGEPSKHIKKTSLTRLTQQLTDNMIVAAETRRQNANKVSAI